MPARRRYKSLKAVLEGGIEGRPETVIFYATSNRRHLMPRDMIENERSHRDQPGGGGGGEGLAVRPLRPVARLPRHRSGDVSARSSPAMPAATASPCRRRTWSTKPCNGRRAAAPAPAASPGSSSRTSPAASASASPAASAQSSSTRLTRSAFAGQVQPSACRSSIATIAALRIGRSPTTVSQISFGLTCG